MVGGAVTDRVSVSCSGLGGAAEVGRIALQYSQLGRSDCQHRQGLLRPQKAGGHGMESGPHERLQLDAPWRAFARMRRSELPKLGALAGCGSGATMPQV